MAFYPKGSKGFTLVELLVVIAIIGILGAIALPQYQRFIWQVKRAEAVALLTGIHKNELVYFATYDQFYPPNAPQGLVGTAVSGNEGNQFFGWEFATTKLGWEVVVYKGHNQDGATDLRSRGYSVLLQNDLDQKFPDDGPKMFDIFFIKNNPVPAGTLFSGCEDGVPLHRFDDISSQWVTLCP